MAVAINIFIFASPTTLSADECADCSNTWTSDLSTTFSYGECSFYIDYDFRVCEESSNTFRELRVNSIQTLTSECDTTNETTIYKYSIMYLLSQYYNLFQPINYWETYKISVISNPCIKPANGSGLIEFCDDTLCQKIEYNMTGADKFVEIVGSHTFSKNYGMGPCTIIAPCASQELNEHFYNIPPGELYPKLYSDPLSGEPCDDPCYWKLEGNNNVDDYFHFIGPTNVGNDFIVKARSDSRGLTERIRVKHNGGIDLKVGNWDESYPQITLDDGGTAAPTIRFYRNSGNPSDLTDVYPFWIQGNIGSSGGLRFLSQEFSNFRAPLGTETPVIRFKINYNGNVGVNKEVPTTRFQVTEGNVLFDGNTTSTTDILPSGAGNRFLWAAEKSALRSGEVTGSQWDESNIGTHSVAFGYNNIASGNFSLVGGSSNTVTGTNAFVSGHANLVTGYRANSLGVSNKSLGTVSITVGQQNEAEGNYSISIGRDVKVYGNYSTAFGHQMTVNGESSNGIGYNMSIQGVKSNAIGNDNNILGNFSNAFGYGLIIKNAKHASAFGNSVGIEDGHDGSFIIGDNNSDTFGHTYSDNKNQITMRFTGDPLRESATFNQTHRLITETDVDGNILNGVFLHRGGNSWESYSDINLKKNIKDIDNYSILEKLRQIHIKSWQWKDIWTFNGSEKVWDDFSYTWLGPMAQDFNSRFSNFGTGDSTKLNSATMDAVMFASIQALADIVDNQNQSITSEKEKIDSLDKYTKELLTKQEFEEFKNDIDCLDSICERVSTLETNYTDLKNNSSTFLTKSEFNSFKDSISCYADACKRIKDLEDTIESLKNRLDELESADSSGADGPIPNQSLNFNFGNLENGVILEQNNPNPFSNETKINYYIPSDFTGQAELMLTDEKGSTIIQKLEACIGKPCTITVSADGLNTGVYVYALLLDGKIIKSQKMMIIK